MADFGEVHADLVRAAGLQFALKKRSDGFAVAAFVNLPHLVVRDGVTAAVRNSGRGPRQTRVTLAVDGRVRADQQITVGGGATVEIPFALRLPSAGAVSVEVGDSDGYAADNVRYAVLDTPPRPRVLAVTSPGAAGDSFYVERALAAAEGPAGMRLERVTAEQVSSDPAALEGAVIETADGDMKDVYGPTVTAREVLFGGIKAPDEVTAFAKTLQSYTPAAVSTSGTNKN